MKIRHRCVALLYYYKMKDKNTRQEKIIRITKRRTECDATDV
jgi:hypothetical protein